MELSTSRQSRCFFTRVIPLLSCTQFALPLHQCCQILPHDRSMLSLVELTAGEPLRCFKLCLVFSIIHPLIHTCIILCFHRSANMLVLLLRLLFFRSNIVVPFLLNCPLGVRAADRRQRGPDLLAAVRSASLCVCVRALSSSSCALFLYELICPVSFYLVCAFYSTHCSF